MDNQLPPKDSAQQPTPVASANTVAVLGPSESLRRHTALLLASLTESRLLTPPPSAHGDESALDTALDAALDTIEEQGNTGSYIIELPGHVDPLETIGVLAGDDAPTRLSNMICCVDALMLEERLVRAVSVQRSSTPDGPSTLLLARQLEYASVIALANTQLLSPDALARTAAIASSLSPDAQIIVEAPTMPHLAKNESYTVTQERAGWIRLLNGDCSPAVRHPHVQGMRYENLRPFHPARLDTALRNIFTHGIFGRIVRSGGFCQVATRPNAAVMWEQAGTELTLTVLPDTHTPEEASGETDEHTHEHLHFGQELAFIGINLDPLGIKLRLDWATLTDSELLAGPETWASYANPNGDGMTFL